LHLRIGLSRFNAICAIGRLRLLVIRNTLRGKRFTPPAFKHLINFIIRRRISLAGYTGEASVSYHGRADGPDGRPAMSPSALTRICHTSSKKRYEFIRTLAGITLPMQLDELIHPNRHKTHCATPFPYVEIDAEPPAIHARFLPMLLCETIPGFLNPQAANRILEVSIPRQSRGL